MKPISFTSHGFKLSGHLFTAKQPKELAFLFIQGWTGHQNIPAAEALAGLGFTCMTYDMRGNGDSEGNLAEFSRADFIDDAITAYDYLREQLPAGTSIGVIGSSFGSYTAVLLSAKRDVICLSLRVPANYPDEGFTDPQEAQSETAELDAWRKKPLAVNQNHTLKALHAFLGPLQIVEADHDELVPHQCVQNFANAVTDKSKLTYDVLHDAPHRLENDRLRADYIELLINWAKQQI